jgi:hypothetical protein
MCFGKRDVMADGESRFQRFTCWICQKLGLTPQSPACIQLCHGIDKSIKAGGTPP